MFEPRVEPAMAARKDLTFLGGAGDYDLFFRKNHTLNGLIEPQHEDLSGTNELYPLRVNRVENGTYNWDVFKLPLRSNTEVNSAMPPAERGITGYWDDIRLTYDEVEMIETYLRCFAPWVLETARAVPSTEEK